MKEENEELKKAIENSKTWGPAVVVPMYKVKKWIRETFNENEDQKVIGARIPQDLKIDQWEKFKSWANNNGLSVGQAWTIELIYINKRHEELDRIASKTKYDNIDFYCLTEEKFLSFLKSLDIKNLEEVLNKNEKEISNYFKNVLPIVNSA